MNRVIIEDKEYSLIDIFTWCNGDCKIELSEDLVKKIKKSRDLVEKLSLSDDSIYGINTGFGKLSQIPIQKSNLHKLQENLLLSHAVGLGPACPQMIVKIMMLLKIISFSKGNSGISISIVEFLLYLFNNNLIPYVPMKGSVGASGDLAPLAHMSLPLLGLGKLSDGSNFIDTNKVLKKNILNKVELGPKEGLALINGTQFSTAYGVYCLYKINELMKLSDVAASMTIEAMMAIKKPFLEKVNRLKPFKGQLNVSKNIINLLKNSEIAEYHADNARVQDIYSIRCIPQVHGSCRDLIEFSCKQINTEINSVSDNPLVFLEKEEIISAGHFHAESIGHALDIAAMSLASISNISERRIFALLSGDYGLPKFLIDNPGLNSGFMMLQVTAAALASENKVLANPSSTDSIPTCSNQEDYVSMAPYSGRKLLDSVNNYASILAIEFLAACQGIDFRKELKPAEKLIFIHKLIRSKVPFLSKDRFLKDDLDEVLLLVNDGAILKEVNKNNNLL